ncbi:hypothetical protein KKB55_06910, partial [Myxococcota bacterium]|nr:hypothetical protein [Myxococcota bacterium]
RRFKTIKALKTLERRFKTIKALKTLERRLKTIKALKTLERRLKTIKALKTLEITIKGLKTLERRLETAKALKTLEKTTKALKTLEKTIKGLKTLEKRRFETLAIYLSKFKHRDFMVPLEHSWLFFREGYAIFDVHLEQFYKFHEIFICLEALLKSSSLHRYLHRGSIPFIVMSHVDTFTLKAQIFAYREIEYSFINKHLILLKEIIRLLERRHNLKSFGLIINKKYIKTVYEILKADRSIYLKESAQRVKNATGVARLILGNQIQSRLRLWICSQGRSLYSKNVNAGWLHVFFVKNERHSCALMEHKIRSDDIDICSKTASMPSRDHAKPSDVHTAP